MATLAAQMVSDVAAVFLDTDEFAKTITQWKRGNPIDTASLAAVVAFDDADPRNIIGESHGISDVHGKRINQSCYIEVADTIDFHPDDKFKLPDGTVLNAVRIIGGPDEGGMVTILCIAPSGLTTKRGRPRM